MVVMDIIADPSALKDSELMDFLRTELNKAGMLIAKSLQIR
jgi:hypothetical protein